MDTAALDSHRAVNRLQSLLMLVAMALLAAALGWLIAGGEGVLWALMVTLFALLLNPAIAPETLLLELLPRERTPLAHLHAGGHPRGLEPESRAPRWRLSGLWH